METTHNELGGYASLREETRAPCPPALFEYTWYVLLAYATLGQAWGVVIPSVGGALLALLALVCLLSVGAEALRVYAPVAFAICTGISVIAVQFFLHSAVSLSISIAFVGWLFTVIIVQALSLRPGFLHRFALAAAGIGLCVLPYLYLSSGIGLARARADETGLSNSNSLGMWFGFCTVYFLFFGVQSRNMILRSLSWVAALGCLYAVGLTVSRGPLLGIVLACVVGFRSALKRHFLPALSLVLLVWLVYESGMFQQTIDYYSARGAVETGRGRVWPVAMQRLLDSPWTGVGLEAIYTPVAWRRAITPHNGLLFIGLAAGIMPVVCFLAYLARAIRAALYMMLMDHAGDDALFPPLVTFGLMEVMTLDTAFMSAWAVVVFSLAAMHSRAIGSNPLRHSYSADDSLYPVRPLIS